MEYIRLGQITKTFGLKGQVRCFSLTDFPAERFQLGAKLSLLNEKTSERKDVTIDYFRDAGDAFFLGFAEWKTIEEAEPYLGYFIEIDKKLAPLPKGYYRLQDLRGCEVRDEKGAKLGIVKDVLSYAPTKTLQIGRENQKDFYVPFLEKEFIVSVDVAQKVIVIHVIPGLL
jgi:16S rRNA processing protein RimM